jgi:hypothetical protein
MPLILSILSDFLKSTQPGIQAAEARVKFLTLGENLVFRKTELIVSPPYGVDLILTPALSQDMDLYGENRVVEHEGTVGRKEKSENFLKERWLDNSAKLLDHYCASFSGHFGLCYFANEVLVLLTEERTTKDPEKEIETKKYFVNSRVRFP